MVSKGSPPGWLRCDLIICFAFYCIVMAIVDFSYARSIAILILQKA